MCDAVQLNSEEKVYAAVPLTRAPIVGAIKAVRGTSAGAILVVTARLSS